MNAPSIDQIIRHVAEKNPASTTSELATRIINKLEPGTREKYLHLLISARIPSVLGQQRSNATPVALKQGKRKGVSTKQALIRDQYWPRYLAQKICVDGVFITLGDATIEDLEKVIAVRRRQIRDLTAKCDEFENLVAIMRSTGAFRVSDLDPRLAAPTAA